MMSSFAHPLLVSRREIPHEPPASTEDRGAPPQRQKPTDASILCPSSPPAGPVLPHIPRPHLRTGAAALLPAPQQRRWPRPSLHASLLQRSALLLPARPPTRLAHPRAPARANAPPAPSRPPCGGGPAAPGVRYPRAPPGLLHRRLPLGPPAPCSPLPSGLRHGWPASPGPCPAWPGRQRPGRSPARGHPHAAAHLLAT